MQLTGTAFKIYIFFAHLLTEITYHLLIQKHKIRISSVNYPSFRTIVNFNLVQLSRETRSFSQGPPQTCIQGAYRPCAISTKYLTILLTVNLSLCSRVSFPIIHESIRGIEIVEAVEFVKASELLSRPWPFSRCTSGFWSTSAFSRSFLKVTGLTSLLERLWEVTVAGPADILLATSYFCFFREFRGILV